MQNRKKTGLDVFEEFSKALKSGAYPIYYICGEEVFFHDRALNLLMSLIPPDVRDFNFDMVYGQDSNVSQVISMCKSYPMMAEKRLVIVRDFQSLTKASGSNSDGSSLNDFLPLIEKPNPTAIAVFMDEKPIPKTTKIGKKIASTNQVGFFEFSVTPDYLVPDWVTNWTKKEHNFVIEPQAAKLLVQFIGSDLLLLSNEIEKLVTAKSKEGVINEKDIRDLVGFSKEFTVFELKDSIIQRRTNDAIQIADHILSQGDGAVGEILKSLGFFNSMYVNIWQYLRAQAKGNSPDEIAMALGINGFRLGMLQKEARLYSLSSMPVIFEILYDADRAMKGFSTLDEQSIFFLTIHRLCSV